MRRSRRISICTGTLSKHVGATGPYPSLPTNLRAPSSNVTSLAYGFSERFASA